jgi:hypothetical protein
MLVQGLRYFRKSGATRSPPPPPPPSPRQARRAAPPANLDVTFEIHLEARNPDRGAFKSSDDGPSGSLRDDVDVDSIDFIEILSHMEVKGHMLVSELWAHVLRKGMVELGTLVVGSWCVLAGGCSTLVRLMVLSAMQQIDCVSHMMDVPS